MIVVSCNYDMGLMDEMKNINGQGNEITIILPHKKIDCISSHHEQFNQIILI